MTTCIGSLADVVAIMIEGKATLVTGRCYCHCGRWNSYIDGMILIITYVIAFVVDELATGSIVYFILIFVQMYTEPHPICEADGI